MSLNVRVQNFQAIKDSEVFIDGFTAITGTNNAGKSALMRAIRGVFVNAPATSLVRHGESFLSVELRFEDGTTILWEKGWEKPFRKGKTINRYTLNGKLLEGVGRGVPPEIEDLGVQVITASSEKIWPQIAQQFVGTLFLVNRPGAAIAEALSDVDRVGLLAKALKMSEKDKRAISSELRVRRKDVKSLRVEVSQFDGLDSVALKVEALEQARSKAQKLSLIVDNLSKLRKHYVEAKASAEVFESFNPSVVPDASRGQKISKVLGVCKDFRVSYTRALREWERLKGVETPNLPDSNRAEQLLLQLRQQRRLRDRLNKARSGLINFREIPILPDSESAEELSRRLAVAQELKNTLDKTVIERDHLERELKQSLLSASEGESQVVNLLGDLGVCPICRTIHKPGDSL